MAKIILWSSILAIVSMIILSKDKTIGGSTALLGGAVNGAVIGIFVHLYTGKQQKKDAE